MSNKNKQNKSKVQQQSVVVAKKKVQQPKKSKNYIVEQRYDQQVVPDNYIRSVLMPENGQGSRIPTRFPVPTATLQYQCKMQATVNNRGQSVIQVQPARVHDPVTLDCVDGIDYATFSSYRGGIGQGVVGGMSNMYRYRPVSAVINYECSLNAFVRGGTRTVAILMGAGVGTNSEGTVQGFSRQQILKETVSDDESIDKKARCIWVPIDPSDMLFRAPGVNYDNAFIALMLNYSGSNLVQQSGSNVIGTISITINYEYIPKFSVYDVIPRQMVRSNNQTQEKVENLVATRPSICYQLENKVMNFLNQAGKSLIDYGVSKMISAL